MTTSCEIDYSVVAVVLHSGLGIGKQLWTLRSGIQVSVALVHVESLGPGET